MIPISTIPFLITSYDLFWESIREANTYALIKARPLNTTLILSVIYGGSVACSDIILKRHFPEHSRRKLSNSLQASLEATLKVEGFPQKPQLHSLVSFVMLQSLKADASPVGMDSNLLALRVAYRLGLHKDPQQSILDPQISETRRRLWWYIVSTEALVCVSFKMPLMAFDMGRSDVRELSEIQDAYLGTEIDNFHRQTNALDDGNLESSERCPTESATDCVSEIILVARSRSYVTRTYDPRPGANTVLTRLYRDTTNCLGHASRCQLCWNM